VRSSCDSRSDPTAGPDGRIRSPSPAAGSGCRPRLPAPVTGRAGSASESAQVGAIGAEGGRRPGSVGANQGRGQVWGRSRRWFREAIGASRSGCPHRRSTRDRDRLRGPGCGPGSDGPARARRGSASGIRP